MRSLLFKALLLQTIFLALLSAPLSAFAQSLSLSPESGNYTNGKIFPVTVYVSTGQALNAISGNLSFNPSQLQVYSISKTGSVITLWVQEPTFSNAGGTVSFEGIVPNPGYYGNLGNVITVNFQVVGQGSSRVTFSGGSILANDGEGTNILKNLYGATYSLGLGAAPPHVSVPPPDVVPVVMPTNVSGTPKAPIITSTTHPDKTLWYAKDDVELEWGISRDITAVKTLLGKRSNSEPTVLYQPAISSKKIENLEDGTWYFHVQLKNSSGWGSVGRYPIRIDTTIPETFTISEVEREDQTDPQPEFSFNAIDVTSGINRYTVDIDNTGPLTWIDDGSGIYRTPILPPGDHNMVVKAYDEAGNFAVSSAEFNILGITVPIISYYTAEIPSNGEVIVKGTSIPNSLVRLTLSKDGVTPISTTVATDQNGAFVGVIDQDFEKGLYSLTATAIDDRGAQSEPSTPNMVVIKGSTYSTLGQNLISTLSLLIPIMALVFALLSLLFYGSRKIAILQKNMRGELKQIESTFDKAAALLKEDVEDSIRLLERTKGKRKLTKEEDLIIERFRQNLGDVKDVMHKEIAQAEEVVSGKKKAPRKKKVIETTVTESEITE